MKDSNSVILQNARITAGKASALEITIVPKMVGFPQHPLFLIASCLNHFFHVTGLGETVHHQQDDKQI